MFGWQSRGGLTLDHSSKPDGSIRIKIQSPSDRDDDEERRLLWGDYWVKHELTLALEDLGAAVVEDGPDALLHLFGAPPKKKPAAGVNVAWVYSHPDDASADSLAGFDFLFCASERFAPRLAEMVPGPVEVLPACTAKVPARVDLEYDVIFLGNARGRRPDGRGIIRDAQEAGLPVMVWGNHWEKHLPPERIGGRYWPYQELQNLYAAARITLNDHHPDMAREGFVSNKVFDILAAGGFVISDPNPGLERLFGDAVPQYQSPGHLGELARYYLDHEDERQALSRQGRDAALRHTYKKVAERLLAALRG